jgi:hypothetical protein
MNTPPPFAVRGRALPPIVQGARGDGVPTRRLAGAGSAIRTVQQLVDYLFSGVRPVASAA